MSNKAQSPHHPKTGDHDLEPPVQVLGILGRAYRLTGHQRRYLTMIDWIWPASLIPLAVSIGLRQWGDWWKWGLVAAAGTFLRFILSKMMLVYWRVKGTDVAVSERKQIWARGLKEKGMVPILWCLPICLAGLIVLSGNDIVTGSKLAHRAMWSEAVLIPSFALSLWLIWMVRRFIRRWTAGNPDA